VKEELHHGKGICHHPFMIPGWHELFVFSMFSNYLIRQCVSAGRQGGIHLSSCRRQTECMDALKFQRLAARQDEAVTNGREQSANISPAGAGKTAGLLAM
jgi:hypothetical protein